MPGSKAALQKSGISFDGSGLLRLDAPMETHFAIQ